MAVHLALMAAPLVMKAQQLGMTNAGARQALNGELITDAADRARVAEIMAEALGGQGGTSSGPMKGIGNMLGGLPKRP